MSDIITCPKCNMRVVPNRMGLCPSCRTQLVGETESAPGESDDDLFRQLLSSLVPYEEIVLRISLGTGCFRCLMGIACLGVGILWMMRFPVQFPATVFPIFVTILGACYLFGGLSYVFNRSPQLRLGSDRLCDHRTRPTQLFIPWSSIVSARYFRQTSNSEETIATIELTLATPIDGRNSVVVPVLDLDRSSSAILEIIRRRANLR